MTLSGYAFSGFQSKYEQFQKPSNAESDYLINKQLFLLQHHPHIPALYEVSDRRLEHLPLVSFRFAVAPTPLLLANDKYCNSRSGLTPYSVMTMPDTQKKVGVSFSPTSQFRRNFPRPNYFTLTP